MDDSIKRRLILFLVSLAMAGIVFFTLDKGFALIVILLWAVVDHNLFVASSTVNRKKKGENE